MFIKKIKRGILGVVALSLLSGYALMAQSTPPPAPAEAAAPAPAAPVPDSLAYPPGLNAGTAVDLTWPIPADSAGINPDGKNKVTQDELIQNVAHNKVSINLVWTLLAGFLVMFMQAGFALVETGLCRAKNAAHVMSMNFLIYALGMLGFWICGYAIMFGGYWNGPVPIGWQPSLGQGLSLLNKEFIVTLFGKPFGLFGYTGFFLNPSVFDTSVFALFLFQMVFMDTTATIPTGSMAERWSMKNFMLYGFWVGMFPYAIYGNWVWGGGWLAQLGMNFGLGHGHVDFAGSSVVHMTGGVIAFVGGALIGPRIGKYDANGKPVAMPAHNIPMVILGTFILAFGWFGFNPGSTLAGTDNRIAIVAVNTMLASAAGALFSCLYMWFFTGKPDPSMMCNGMLAGLVAITAPCAFVSSLGAVIIGASAGILVIWTVFFVERTLKIDDPVGAIAVHGVNGAWGVISLGLFANGSYGAGWGGVHVLLKDGVQQIINNDAAPATLKKYAELTGSGWADQGVTGAFGTLFGASYNDWSQLGAQTIGTVTNIVFIGAFAFVWFKLSNLVFPLRPKAEDEIQGLDMPEMGAEAYPDMHIADRSK
ncbi:MAG: ammonium transporter [Verrucomicrobiota bacterium]